MNFFIKFTYKICISGRSASQILSIKDEYTFPLLNFVITGFCNSSAIYLFDILSFCILSLFFVNGTQELYVNPSCLK